MTHWIYLPTTIFSAANASISEGSSAYIADGVLYAAQNVDSYTLLGTYDNTQVRVEGTVGGYHCILLGNNSLLSTGEIVTVSDSGKIFSNDTAVELRSWGSTLHNDGSIIATNIGVILGGAVSGTLSEVINGGSIDGGSYGIKIGTGAENVNVTNSGTIKGIISSYETAGDATDQIINTGVMDGQVILGDGDDFYTGNKGHIQGAVLGGADTDKLIGGSENNEFYGQSGTDTLTGSKGADLLSGGTEADTFIYRTLSDSTNKASGRDIIINFLRADGDQIDLHIIDADSNAKGNQAFDLIGKAAFSHEAGELRFEKTGGHTMLLGDVNGDGKSDISIEFDTALTFKDADFIF